MKRYIEDTDPDCILDVGADMRKIQMCFSLLKVIKYILGTSSLTVFEGLVSGVATRHFCCHCLFDVLKFNGPGEVFWLPWQRLLK